MSKPGREPKREQGQIIVLFVLAIVVIMGFAALVIDVGRPPQRQPEPVECDGRRGARRGVAAARRRRPVPTNASTIALQYAGDNYPGGLPAGVTVGFRCVVGSASGVPRASDIPAVCDPGPNASWTCNATICSSVCIPDEGDTCNTIVLESTASVAFDFGRAVGVESGQAHVLSAACKGPCGAKPIRTPSILCSSSTGRAA